MRKQLLGEDQRKKERQKQDEQGINPLRDTLTHPAADAENQFLTVTTAGYLERAWSLLKGEGEDASAVQQAIAEARAREQRLESMLGPPPTPPAVPKVRSHVILHDANMMISGDGSSFGHAHDACMLSQGIYLYGSVGSGKTMVMDLAFNTIEELGLVPKMRRVHFNRALDELHQRMHKLESARMQLSAQQMDEFAQSVAMQERQSEAAADAPSLVSLVIQAGHN